MLVGSSTSVQQESNAPAEPVTVPPALDGAQWLRTGQTYPPPGRLSLSFEDAENLLVRNPIFAESETRVELWENFGGYLSRFLKLEEEYAQDLQGHKIVEFVWLGGSFVSNKLDPRNLDITVAVSVGARPIVKGRPGAGWLTAAFSRESILREYKISPIELPYKLVPSIFRSEELLEDDQAYLRERGAWDDWWQRTRNADVNDRAPSASSARARRGYLEVIL